MKIGLVLEGGAMRGMYTAGILDTFIDNNIKVDGIIGVSAGVLFGVNYLSKQKGRVIRYNKKYINEKNYMGMYSLITSGNVINKDFAYYTLPSKLDVFDEKTYEENYVPFYAVATNVESGKPEYIELKNVFKQMELLRATSAMPFVSKIVEYEGKKYLDGGTSDSIPLEKCKEMGFDKIIVVLTRPIDYRKSKPNEVLAKIFYRKYPNLIKTINERYLMYNDEVENVIKEENSGNIFVFRPSKLIDLKRIEKDPDKLQEMYDLGLSDSKEKLNDLLNYLNK